MPLECRSSGGRTEETSHTVLRVSLARVVSRTLGTHHGERVAHEKRLAGAQDERGLRQSGRVQHSDCDLATPLSWRSVLCNDSDSGFRVQGLGRVV